MLRCAAAIAPLSLDGMVHTDENAKKCTLSYVPSSQKLDEGAKPQQVQTVKFQCEFRLLARIAAHAYELVHFLPFEHVCLPAAHTGNALSVAVLHECGSC